jgi:hypothetical protein
MERGGREREREEVERMGVPEGRERGGREEERR